MAYDVNSGDVLEFTIQSRHAGQRILSVFHYQLVSVAGPLDGPTVVNTFNGLINTAVAGDFLQSYADGCSASLTIEQLVYQWIYVQRRARIVKVPAVTAGTVAGDSEPPNLAAALTKMSEVAGRHGHGTLHMPALAQNHTSLGLLTDPGVGVYDDLVPNLFAIWSLGGANKLNPVIFARANPASPVQVTGSRVERTVRTMHRRTVAVGE